MMDRLVLAGKRMKELREQKMLSQEEFADRLAWKKSNVSMIESGERNLTLEKVIELSNKFNVDVKWFLDEATTKPDEQPAIVSDFLKGKKNYGVTVEIAFEAGACASPKEAVHDAYINACECIGDLGANIVSIKVYEINEKVVSVWDKDPCLVDYPEGEPV